MIRRYVLRLFAWVLGTPTDEVTTGVVHQRDGVPLAQPEERPVVRAVLANGEVWESPLTRAPGGI